jgi:hypothetical protein
MLAAAPNVAYIHEPFNYLAKPAIGPLVDGFTYVDKFNGDRYRSNLADVLNHVFPLRSVLANSDGAKDAARQMRDYLVSVRHRVRGSRPLMKDPIAIFSAEWVAAEFDMEVVVLIRHPVAFASSLRRLGWTYQFESLLGQPEFLAKRLEPFESEIRAFAKSGRDIVDQAALLWNMIHYSIIGYRDRHPEWIFRRYEDLVNQPMEQFRELYGLLDLEMSTSAERTIRDSSASSNPAVPPRNPVHGVRRDSLTVSTQWRDDMSPEDVDRIRVATSEIAAEFYTDSDW